MQPSEMTNVQIADYILSLQSDVDGSPFSSNEIIREAAKRLLTDGDDNISKDAEIAEIRHWIKSAARWIKCHDIYHTSGDDLIKQAKEILNDDDGEFLFKKGEQ